MASFDGSDDGNAHVMSRAPDRLASYRIAHAAIQAADLRAAVFAAEHPPPQLPEWIAEHAASVVAPALPRTTDRAPMWGVRVPLSPADAEVARAGSRTFLAALDNPTARRPVHVEPAPTFAAVLVVGCQFCADSGEPCACNPGPLPPYVAAAREYARALKQAADTGDPSAIDAARESYGRAMAAAKGAT